MSKDEVIAIVLGVKNAIQIGQNENGNREKIGKDENKIRERERERERDL